MLPLNVITTTTFMVICYGNSAFCQTTNLSQGFVLDSTFEQAQRHADSQNWFLTKISPELPYQWLVNGADINLFVCDNKVIAISKKIVGNIDEFVSLVKELQVKWGKPDISIVSIKANSPRKSRIAARFITSNEENLEVQLSTNDGKAAVHVDQWSNIKCPSGNNLD